MSIFKTKLILYTVFILFIALLVSLEFSLFHYTVDDAYVGIRYAQNLVDGYGFAYNQGERLEGYSTFLWILLFALFLKLNLNVIFAAKITGMIFSVLNLFIVYKLTKLIIQTVRKDSISEKLIAKKDILSTKLITKEDLFSLMPVFLLSITPAYALWAVGALETQMYIFFLLLGIYFFVKEIVLDPNIYISSLFFALAALVRHEAAVLFVISFFFRCFYLIKQHNFFKHNFFNFFSNKLILKKIFLWGLLFCLIYGTFFVWRIAYFGHVFPSPFFAKNSDFESSLIKTSYGNILPQFVQDSSILMKALVYAGRIHFQWPLFIYFMPFVVLLVYYFYSLFYYNYYSNYNHISIKEKVWSSNLISENKTLIINYLILITFAIIFIGLQFYDWMPGHRYILPAFLIVYVFCAVLLSKFFTKTTKLNTETTKLNNFNLNNTNNMFRYFYKLHHKLSNYNILILFFILYFVVFNAIMYVSIKNETLEYSKQMDDYVKLGFWLKKNVLPETTLAIQNAGIIPYFAGLPLVHIHQMPVLNKDIVYNSTLTYDYIFAKKPDLIIFFSKKAIVKDTNNTNIYPSLAGFYVGLYNDTRFSKYYEVIGRFCSQENLELWIYKQKGKQILKDDSVICKTGCLSVY